MFQRGAAGVRTSEASETTESSRRPPRRSLFTGGGGPTGGGQRFAESWLGVNWRSAGR